MLLRQRAFIGEKMIPLLMLKNKIKSLLDSKLAERTIRLNKVTLLKKKKTFYVLKVGVGLHFKLN